MIDEFKQFKEKAYMLRINQPIKVHVYTIKRIYSYTQNHGYNYKAQVI